MSIPVSPLAVDAPVESSASAVSWASIIAGALIGGILGHQVGGGTGKDIATAGGAVAGVIIGSNVGTDRYGNTSATRDVQRCTTQPASREPAYWDVSYQFRGVTHHDQLRSPPSGRSIPVNADGEPRD